MTRLASSKPRRDRSEISHGNPHTSRGSVREGEEWEAKEREGERKHASFSTHPAYGSLKRAFYMVRAFRFGEQILAVA